MSKIQTFLFVASLSSLLREHPMCLTNLLLMIPTAAGEQLLETLAFQCPKDRYLAVRSSLLFLCLPVIILFIISMVVNAKFWHVYQGCVKRKSDLLKRRQKYCTFWIIAYQSLAVPCVWLFVALLDGTYIVCCFAEKPDESTEATIEIQAFSQMTAWLLLMVMVCLGTMVTCCVRCCDKNTFLQNIYKETYSQKLEEETKKKAIKKAEEDARTLILEITNEVEPDDGEKETENGNVKADNGFEIDSGIYEGDNRRDEPNTGRNEPNNARNEPNTGRNEPNNARNEPNNGFLNRWWKSIRIRFNRKDPESSQTFLLRKPEAGVDQPVNEKTEPEPESSVSSTKQGYGSTEIDTDTSPV